MKYPKSRNIQGTKYIGTWGEKIPVYDVYDTNGLNQLIGYIKHINAASGTVLYRGQCKLYEHLVPSIKHELDKEEVNERRLQESLDKMICDKDVASFFSFDEMVRGWELYSKIMYEAVFQHYGASTYSVDFVDNHWTALWFGLNKWDEERKKYVRRSSNDYPDEEKHITFDNSFGKIIEQPKKPKSLELSDLTDEERRKGQEIASYKNANPEEVWLKCLAERQELLEKKYQNKMKRYDAQLDNLERERRAQDMENMKAHMFLFMYVSDTDVPVVHGLYMGKDTYIVDLRKALPSTFLRPVSQHGWIVKGKKKDFDFDRNVACVIRIAIERVDEWIGTGHLLSQDNFFPEPDRDLGYHMLLSRQEHSGIGMKKRKILPKDMVMSINSGNGK